MCTPCLRCKAGESVSSPAFSTSCPLPPSTVRSLHDARVLGSAGCQFSCNWLINYTLLQPWKTRTRRSSNSIKKNVMHTLLYMTVTVVCFFPLFFRANFGSPDCFLAFMLDVGILQEDRSPSMRDIIFIKDCYQKPNMQRRTIPARSKRHS